MQIFFKQKNTVAKTIGMFVMAVVLLTTLAPTTIALAFGRDSVDDYTLLAPLPGTSKQCETAEVNTYSASNGKAETTTQNCRTNFLTYITGFFKLVIGISAILAILVITYGGFEYMTSVSESATSKAKERIQNAVIGLLLVLSSYLIVNTINPKLTKIDFTFGKISDAGLTEKSVFLEDPLNTMKMVYEQNILNDRSKLLAQRETLRTKCQNEGDTDCFAQVAELDKKIEEANRKINLNRALIDINNIAVTDLNAVGNDEAKAKALRDKLYQAKERIIANMIAKGYTEQTPIVIEEYNKAYQIIQKKIDGMAAEAKTRLQEQINRTKR